jgi:hypothetical protein
MPKLRLIKKIEHKNDKLKILWDESSFYGHVDERSVTSRVEPHQDFYSALRALDKPMCVECELVENEDEYIRHDIIGVDFQHDEDKQTGDLMMSASIKSLRRMENSDEPMKLVSPMKNENATYTSHLHSNTVEKLNTLITEAFRYIDGKRNDLFANEVKEVSEQ